MSKHYQIKYSLYTHVARFQPPEVPATSVLSACCAASDDTPPQPGWRRPRGRRSISWLHQICTDLNRPVSDALNLALDQTSWRTVAVGYTQYDDKLAYSLYTQK